MTTPGRPPEVLHYAAFTDDPSGGNPAGVVLDATELADVSMQAVAARIGYSETAFVTGSDPEQRRLDVRYFSPAAEVRFCGHATIATAVAWAERHGPGRLTLRTAAGSVDVQTHVEPDGPTATLASVPTQVSATSNADVAEALAALGWHREDLDPTLPPRVAYAGEHHLVLAARTRGRLADLEYDFDRLRSLMDAHRWTTLHLVWRATIATYYARDPFPPGGVVEDPATGAAAAAFGAYLRSLQLVTPPARITINQGDDLGRPSRLTVDIPAGDRERIQVTGRAVPLGPAASVGG